MDGQLTSPTRLCMKESLSGYQPRRSPANTVASTRGCKKSLGKLTAYSLAALPHLHAQPTLHHLSVTLVSEDFVQ